jgi:hypothetical protein
LSNTTPTLPTPNGLTSNRCCPNVDTHPRIGGAPLKPSCIWSSVAVRGVICQPTFPVGKHFTMSFDNGRPLILGLPSMTRCAHWFISHTASAAAPRRSGSGRQLRWLAAPTPRGTAQSQSPVGQRRWLDQRNAKTCAGLPHQEPRRAENRQAGSLFALACDVC